MGWFDYDHYTGSVLRFQLTAIGDVCRLFLWLWLDSHRLDCGFEYGIFAGQIGDLHAQLTENDIDIWLWGHVTIIAAADFLAIPFPIISVQWAYLEKNSTNKHQ